MKKIISSVLCLVMLLGLSVPASAKIVDGSDSTGQSNDYVLTYSNEASYEITIPESGDIDIATGKGTITIGVTEANLEENTVVKVTAVSSNYTDDFWYLVNTKDSTDKIAYTIGTTDGGFDVVSGNTVLSADSATSASFYVTVSDTSKVGTFTDTITFTSEIVKLIDFTIGGTPYQAEENMTWVDWVGSVYNTGEFSVNNSSSWVAFPNGYLKLSSNNVVKTDKIVSGGAYSQQYVGGAD